MKEKISFRKAASLEQIEPLRSAMYSRLSAPFDGMWDQIIHENSEIWVVQQGTHNIGYFCRDNEQKLLNFFLYQKDEMESRRIFQRLIDEQFCKGALIGTNNPFLLNLGIARAEEAKLHSYFFKDNGSLNIPPVELKGIPVLEKIPLDSLKRAVSFCFHNAGGDETWLKSYLEKHIHRGELYSLSDGKEWIGYLEVRQSDTQEGIADLGVITSQKFRKQGIGTFLLLRGKEIAYNQKHIPICSCEATNSASKRMIQKAGFVPWHRLFDISFQPRPQQVAVG